MNTHVVIKKIPGINAEVGAQVDASEWRNARLLTEQRYLKALDVAADPLDHTLLEANFDQRVVDVLTRHLQSDDSPLLQLLRDRLFVGLTPDTSQKRVTKTR